MERCGGRLLMHEDGTPAACTEELDGRMCPGMDAPHAKVPVTCEDVLGPGACELCAPDRWSDIDWRHVVHVGQMGRGQGFCIAHHGRRPVATVHVRSSINVGEETVLLHSRRPTRH